MKRRETKKNIRKEERYLTQIALEYLEVPEPGRDTEENRTLLFLCLSLTMLLSDHLKLYSNWDSRERWLDGIEDPVVELTPTALKIAGPMTWGLLSKTAGEQWDEPFAAVIRLSVDKRRIVSYELSFGEGGELYQFPRDKEVLKSLTKKTIA